MGGKMPTSCKDLELMGQIISGIFLVKNDLIDAVFCDFNPKTNNGNYKHQLLLGNYSAQLKFFQIRKFRKMDRSR